MNQLSVRSVGRKLYLQRIEQTLSSLTTADVETCQPQILGRKCTRCTAALPAALIPYKCIHSFIQYSLLYPLFIPLSTIHSFIHYSFLYPLFIPLSTIHSFIHYSFLYPLFIALSTIHSLSASTTCRSFQ